MRVPARWPRSARSDIRGIAGEARVRQCEGAHGRCGCRPVARVGRMGAVPRTKESECSSGAATRSSRSARSTSTGPGKTVTEYDDHLFCLLTMNHHPLHLDANYAEETTQFGKNVVVGNYIYSLLLGMSVPDVSGKAIANLEIESLRHVAPTFHGDTIYGETTVLDKWESTSQGRPRRRPRRDDRLQPGRQGRLHLPPQGDGAEAELPRRPRRRAARPPDARAGQELAGGPGGLDVVADVRRTAPLRWP